MTFKLNMSDEEVESKDFEFPPTGNYLVRITELELKEVQKTGDNFGKPFWKLTLVIEEGPLKGQTIPTQVMLFEGASNDPKKKSYTLVTLKQLCEALHPEYIEGNQINLPSVANGSPDPDPWIGQLVNIKGANFPVGSKRKNGEIREYVEFKITYKKPASAGTKAAASGIPMPS